MLRLIACLAILIQIAGSKPTHAQEPSPVTVVSGGFSNPRAVLVDASGQVIVAEAGAGGDTAGTAEIAAPVGPVSGGPTGRISVVADGCPTPAIEGLPSARNAYGDVYGPGGIATYDDRAFVLVSGGGEGNGNPGQVSGIYEITSGSAVLFADLGAWFDQSQLAQSEVSPAVAGGAWIGLVANPTAGGLFVAEQTTRQILGIDINGQIHAFADLSGQPDLPTALFSEPDGSLLVAMAPAETTAPGQTEVQRIRLNGTTELVWSNLTMVSSLARDRDGALFATQLSDVRDRPPYLTPGSGSIVRQAGADAAEVLIDQLNFPGGLTLAPDTSLYAVLSTSGSDSGTGLVIRIDPAGAFPVQGESLNLAAPSCTANVSAVEIVIDDRGFNPSTITIAPGTTVTWRFGGEFDHVVVSDPESPVQFDSGVLPPGQTFSVVFTEPGTYPYFDGLFPERTAEIVVTD